MYKLHLAKEAAEELKRAYGAAKTILEYGTGGSTLLAAANPGGTIFAVESDKAWLEGLMRHIAAENLPGQVFPLHIDIGDTKEWGFPAGRTRAEHFPNYAIVPWLRLAEQNASPDLILIDGRFRVACFLASLAFIQQPVRIYFDDYVNRHYYHVVEKFAKPAETFGVTAAFDVSPGQITGFQLLSEVGRFFDAR